MTELWPPPCRARRSRRSWPSRQSAGSAKERRRAASDQRPDHSRRKPAAVWQQAAQRRRRRRTMPRAYICVVSRRATAPSCSLGVSTAARRAACGAARPRSSTRSSSRPNSSLPSALGWQKLPFGCKGATRRVGAVSFVLDRPFCESTEHACDHELSESLLGTSFRCPSQWYRHPCCPRYARCTGCQRRPQGSPNVSRLAHQRRMCLTSKQRCVLLLRL